MEEVQNLRTTDAGEEVLIAAAEAHHLMREDGANDDNLVVVEDPLVDGHGDIHGEETAGQGADFFGRNDSQRFQGSRIVPLVIEKTNRCILRGTLFRSDLQPGANGLFRHGRMRSQSDENIQGSH